MFETVKQSIMGGAFELADILHRIDVLYASAALTDDEREQLIELAREHADPAKSLAPLEPRVEALELSIAELKATVDANAQGMAAIKEAVEKLGEQVVVPEPEPEPSDEWPDYVQPTGAHDAYKVGDKITFSGERYTCKMDACVWDPFTYPAAWEYVEDAPSDEPTGAK